MQSQYDDSLFELMTLIVNREPKVKILAKANELKKKITQAFMDTQNTMRYLDGMVSRYAPDEKWHSGFFMENVETIRRFIPPEIRLSQIRQPVPTVTNKEHVAEIARRVTREGIVETKAIINQLRTEGEQRPERVLAISIGNILSDRGYARIGTGQYRLKDAQQTMEVK